MTLGLAMLHVDVYENNDPMLTFPYFFKISSDFLIIYPGEIWGESLKKKTYFFIKLTRYIRLNDTLTITKHRW